MISIYDRVARCAAIVGAIASPLAITTPACADFTSFSVGGDNTAASIQAAVNAFRAALGDPNNASNPGLLTSGRREINWDGGTATTATVTNTPTLTGFQNTRGATFTTPGTGFLQTPLTDIALTNINATYATTFNFFSQQRIFVPTGSNITEVVFSIPGTGGALPATVAGFGAVFTDVDSIDATTIEFFNSGGTSIFSKSVAPGMVANGSLSFLGAIANAGERIAKVRIKTGNMALGPNDQPAEGADVAAMDDFLYSEPTPEPTTAVLALLGIAAALQLRARRE